jgi:hypothetical protein
MDFRAVHGRDTIFRSLLSLSLIIFLYVQPVCQMTYDVDIWYVWFCIYLSLGHMCVCEECAPKLTECPLCRKEGKPLRFYI